jgi:hypothetical protein
MPVGAKTSANSTTFAVGVLPAGAVGTTPPAVDVVASPPELGAAPDVGVAEDEEAAVVAAGEEGTADEDEDEDEAVVVAPAVVGAGANVTDGALDPLSLPHAASARPAASRAAPTTARRELTASPAARGPLARR